MKKIIATFYTLLILCYSLNAQREVTMQSPHSGGDVKACETIILKPGFSFTANSSSSLNLYIHPQDCSLHPHIPIAHEINTSSGYAVGEIPLSFSLNSSGAATYNVPIEVAEGINGVNPSISLSYNSQAGNGTLGIGWSVSGISSISRTNMTVHHNGRVGPVKQEGTDQLCLDGMRLYELSRTNEYVLFETEQGYIRVIGYLDYAKENYFYFIKFSLGDKSLNKRL